ncbi:MAG TPA: alanine racemase [Peptococcaceae bacterium]|nr:MAG: Alanine racemase [Clostridia bacterium 41_269]HBT20778.1 alanine racemase [Peptococcaceae bacterium]
MIARPAWAEINLDNLAHNIREVRRIVNSKSQIMAVVKANAYGHGVYEAGRVFLENGARYLGVAILDEAVKLRLKGFNVPIVILGYTPVSDLGMVVEYDLIQTIFDLDHANFLSEAALRQGKKAKIHIKIDTGMGRLGFPAEEKSVEIVEKIAELPGIFIEGIYTHFASADTKDKTYTLEQLKKFCWFLEKLRETGIDIPIKHAANSAALMDIPETHLDMVRPGIILYGLYPSDEVDKSKISLKPALSLKAQVASVKRMKAGSSISYGCTYTLKKDSLVAVLPIGYADGYSWLLSNKGYVLVGGKRVPIIGRVCMDQLMVDVSSVPDVKIGDEAVFIGRQGAEEITAEDIARWIGTINYEVICMISERVPRRYLSHQKGIL